MPHVLQPLYFYNLRGEIGAGAFDRLHVGSVDSVNLFMHTRRVKPLFEPVSSKRYKLGMYADWRLRSDCAFAQSDQSFQWVLYG